MIPDFIKKDLIPHKPGIYIYKDKSGEILYVGKAIDLYSRVSSYFNIKHAENLKTQHLVKNINSVETIIVESELEALILEANLIKKYLPPFNIKLTDDKDYLYIGITDEDYPKIITARKQDLKILKRYFGPFPSGKTVRDTLKQLRRIFPWCSNPPGKNNKKLKPCFYYHIKLCPGPCAGNVSKDQYIKNINIFSKFMEGKKEELISELQSEMNILAEKTYFEEAQRNKKIIDGINYLLQPNRVQRYLENPNFLEDLNQETLKELQKELHLDVLPQRIEAYDISNIQGKDATGAMVVITNGEIDKSQYRKFKIKISGKPNDYAMHSELMQRRLNHDEWPIADLFIIDGGKGQVKAAYSELVKKDINKPIFGIAKRMEWLYSPEGKIIKLPKRSIALRLLQKIRDESHRFAINYHRKLRSKSMGI